MGGAIRRPSANQKVVIRHTEQVVCGDNGVVPKPKDHLTGIELTPIATVGHPIRLINLTTGARTQIVAESTSISIDGTKAINFVNPAMLADETENTLKTKKGDQIRIFWEVEVANNSGAETAVEVTISPDTFPGTYKIVGDTFMRSADTGKDEPFQFIINKAKVQSNVTLTLEAEGKILGLLSLNSINCWKLLKAS